MNKFSDIAKKLHFCTFIIVNISVAPPLDQKLLINKESSENDLNVCRNKNWIGGWGVCEI